MPKRLKIGDHVSQNSEAAYAAKLAVAARMIVPIESRSPSTDALEGLLKCIRACRVCRDRPFYGKPLTHRPRPILQVSKTARICVAGQAPGTRVHKTGRPFDDPSGVRAEAVAEH